MALLPMLLASSLAAGPPGGFTLSDPEAFKVEKVAGDDLAHDIYTITTDDQDRVYVSGPGYIRILHDRDSDGVFEAASDFFRGPPGGCQGMAYRNRSLFTTSDRGLERYDDADSDGVADGPPELLLPLSGGEHGAHALRFGPDGALYFLGGNHCGLPRDRVSGASPIRDYYAGVFCRMDPRAERIDVWTHGMRNAYDFDFTEDGEAIGWDSDSERNEGLSWYRPCRIYHFTPGADCGWRGMGTGELPAGTLESIAPAAEVHRGSPTGVLCYRHNAFPERYRGGIFALDWTFGRVYFFRLSRRGATFKADAETFIQSAENVSFAPTDMVTAPDGSIWISSGGRGIAGTVYRVTAIKPGPAPTTKTATPPTSGSKSGERGVESLRLQMADADPWTRRAAIEQAMPLLAGEAGASLAPPILRCANTMDARLGHAVLAALALVPGDRLPVPTTAAEKVVLGFALARSTPRGQLARRGVDLALAAAAQRTSGDLLTEALRLLSASFDRLKAREDPEYFTHDPEWERVDLAPCAEMIERSLVVARGQLELDGPAAMEALRLCAKLRDGSPRTAAIAVSRLTESSDAAQDMLIVWCLSQLKSSWNPGTRELLAAWAIGLDLKLKAQQVGRDEKWGLFQRAIWERLLERHPELGTALVSSPEFGRAQHLDIVSAGSRDLRAQAAQKLLDRLRAGDPEEKPERLDFLVENLPLASLPELVAHLRKCASDAQLRRAAIRGLARSPSEEDREIFVEALTDGDPALLRPALDGLSRISRGTAPCAEAIQLLVWSARVEKDSAREAERRLLSDRLRVITGGAPGLAREWIGANCPDRRQELESALASLDEGQALVAKLLETVPWVSGDPDRGRKVFAARSCGNCHHVGGIGQRVGPDLAGVGRRLGLKELLIEIVDPSRLVPDRYFFNEYAMASGEVVQGKEIYSANTSILAVLRDGSFRRLDPRSIAETRPQRLSLMPAGLLTGLGPAEVADLMAFVRSQ